MNKNCSISTSCVNSQRKKINELLKNSIFQIISLLDVFKSIRIFNSQFVDEIKNIEIATIFEKSRLIMQAYNDHDKIELLIQAFIIQRINLRLIFAFFINTLHKFYLRDIFQACVQSITFLNRDFYVRLSNELNLQKNTILQIIKSFYEIFEANVY